MARTRRRKLHIGTYTFTVEFRPREKMEDHFGWFEKTEQRIVVDEELAGWDLVLWLTHEIMHACWWIAVPRGEESIVSNLSNLQTEALRRNRWLREMVMGHMILGG